MKRQFVTAAFLLIVLLTTSYTRQGEAAELGYTVAQGERAVIQTAEPISAKEQGIASPQATFNKSIFHLLEKRPFGEHVVDSHTRDLLVRRIEKELLRHPQLSGGEQPFRVDDIRIDGGWALFNLIRFSNSESPDQGAHVVLPDLALGIARQNEGNDANWEITFEGSNAFQNLVSNIPDSLLSDPAKEVFLSAPPLLPNSTTAVYTVPGLPWAVNSAWRYNGSWDSSHKAFDFGTPVPGQSGQVYAAESGSVVYSYQTCLIVRRGGDNLELLYQHINPSDVATWQIGESVTYGQSIIGMTTVQDGCGGTSSGHHVHFSFRPSGGTYPTRECMQTSSTMLD